MLAYDRQRLQRAHVMLWQLDVHGLQVVRRHLLALATHRFQRSPGLEQLRYARYDVAAAASGDMNLTFVITPHAVTTKYNNTFPKDNSNIISI